MHFDGKSGYLSVKPLSLVEQVSIPFEMPGQQGIDTDNVHIFVSISQKLYKINFAGGILDVSETIDKHFGGLVLVGDYIYAAISGCSEAGSDYHHVYKYDKNLDLITDYDISSHFTICAGAIGYYDGHFYVGESFFDSDHFDRIVEFDSDFTFVAEHVTDQKSIFGIQGITYLPGLNVFQINSHGIGYYRINTSFTNASIVASSMPFSLQDVCVYNTNYLLYCDRNSYRILRYKLYNPSVLQAYTSICRFILRGGGGTRRYFYESSPSGYWISAEVRDINTLRYFVECTTTPVLKDTGIYPAYNEEHVFAVVYKKDDYTKFYYDGVEIVSARGVPSGNLTATSNLVIGTYRVATDRFFPGDILEFALFGRVLSDAEIKHSISEIPSPLIHLKDIVNGTAVDLSGRGQHAALHGGVTGGVIMSPHEARRTRR